MNGPSLELYKKIIDRFPELHFIASGGIRSLDDIYRLGELGCKGSHCWESDIRRIYYAKRSRKC